MAVDLTKLTAVMKTALLRNLGDEVDLIIHYGSQIKGNTHAYSDLDISYVPAHETTGYHITVLVDDMLCDLYPIRWSQLESMANFENVSSTVLLTYQIIYQKSEVESARIATLADQLRGLLEPAARPTIITKACTYFQQIGYPFYLLQEQAAKGHALASLHHTQQILGILFHTLAIFNQRCIDTRKLEQVLALPTLPTGFAETVDQILHTTAPNELRTACERLIMTTRSLLVAGQRQHQTDAADFRTAFGAGYPELKGDLQHLLLACERQDRYSIYRLLISLYHELALVLAQGATGLCYSGFNSLADYEQPLVALGFPALLPYVETADYTSLHQQCLAFEQQLQQFMRAHSVESHAFADVEALQRTLLV